MSGTLAYRSSVEIMTSRPAQQGIGGVHGRGLAEAEVALPTLKAAAQLFSAELTVELAQNELKAES
jgi:hypothetical protein